MTKQELFDKLCPLCDKYTISLSRKYSRFRLEDDFRQVGRIALWESLNRHDDAIGDPWAYSKMRIWGACMDWVRTSSWFPRSCKNMRMASLHTQSHQAGEQSYGPHHRWERENIDLVTTAHDFTSSQSQDCDSDHTGAIEGIYSEQIRKRLAIAARQLPGKQRVIIEGMLADKPMKEIAEELGLSEGRVSQIASKALAALRSMSV